MWPRSATASPPCSRSTTRSSTAGAAWTPTSPAAWQLRHDWGPQYRSAHFTGLDLAWLGISDDAAFLGEPETNGCAERWIRTLKEQCLWVELHDTIDELRQAVSRLRRPLQHLVADRTTRPPDPEGGLSGSTSGSSGMIN